MNNLLKYSIVLGISAALVSCGGNQSKEETVKEEPSAVITEEISELPITKIPNVTNGAEAYFSPDGKAIIFNGKMDADTTHQVYTVNIDGTDLKKINEVGDDACSHFTPDGEHLIWTSTKDNLDMHRGNYSDPQDYPQGAELYMSDLEGGNIVRLTNNKQYDAEVGISPNGEIILFSRQTDGMIDLWTMNPDGSDQKQITFTPDWQEGGAFIMEDNKTILLRAWKKSEEGQEKKDMHPLLIVAAFVYEFLSIHPYQDGNGRLSRLLTTLLLMKLDYPFIQYVSFEHVIETRKDEYYKALMEGQRKRNTPEERIGLWVGFFLESLIILTQRLEAKYEVYNKLKIILNERQQEVIEYVEKQQATQIGEIEKALKGYSRNTLKKDLAYLVNEGLILKTGSGRGVRYHKKEQV